MPSGRGCRPSCRHGERFEGLLPPLVAAPTFSIRKPASLVFTLDDYVAPA
jgi:Flp pilus assembly CpaF family ATPase